MIEKKMVFRLLVIALLVTSVTSAAVVASDSAADESLELVAEESTTTWEGLELTVKFYEEMVVEVHAYNPNSEVANEEIGVLAGNRMDRVDLIEANIEPFSEQTWEYDLYEYQHPRYSEQNIIVMSSNTNLNHSYDISPTAEDRDEVNLMRIDDVSLEANRTGETPHTDLYVTIENPSEFLYSHTLAVHTEETARTSIWPETDRNDTYTERIELNEDPDQVVEGEIRLFQRDLQAMNDSLDMVAFEGDPTGDGTAVEDRAYEPVHPNYNYEPENDERSDDDLPMETPSGDALVVIAILALGGVAIAGIVGAKLRAGR